MTKKKEEEDEPDDTWRDDWFKEHGVTEDDDKSFLNSRALADEFVEEARKRRNPKPPGKKGLFGDRRKD
jgi:hypothetical protein